MLDHDEGISAVAQSQENLEQFLDVREMKPGRRFVEQVEGAAGGLAGEFRGELHPLGLTSGKCRGRLTEPEVTEANLLKHLQLSVDLGNSAEEPCRLIDREFQDVGDILSLVGDLQGLAVEAPSAAEFAGDKNIRQKVHLDADHPVALALLTAPPLDVAGEPGRRVAANLGGGKAAEEIPDRAEDTGIGGGIRPRCASDGTLVDHHHLVEGLGPQE